jgi:hypothetical protein
VAHHREENQGEVLHAAIVPESRPRERSFPTSRLHHFALFARCASFLGIFLGRQSKVSSLESNVAEGGATTLDSRLQTLDSRRSPYCAPRIVVEISQKFFLWLEGRGAK